MFFPFTAYILLPFLPPVWSRPPDFLIFTGVMVYLVRLFQDTNLALRATEVRTGRQGSNVEAEGTWKKALFFT